jgi:hypothetical protein
VENVITDITRRAIVDMIATRRVSWAGRLQEPEFLSRLYDLTEMPSTDNRVRNAAADIHMHRVNWPGDWNDDWVFYDPRFNLMQGPDDDFLRFLCETIHPAVRPDAAEAQELSTAYNQELAADGYTLVEVKQISGRPVFAARRSGQRLEVFEEPTGWQKVDRQMQEVRMRLDTGENEEQFQAVGLLCREVLISVAQEVFDPARHVVEEQISVSETDAKRMLDAILAGELEGATNEEARAHAKAAIRLALALQHRRTADFKTAALCAEATSSTVNILAVLAGRRGRLVP